MNATRSQLIAQYNRAKKLLWTEHFREAANTHTPGLFDTADLMAIGSRETNLDPKWLTKKGDNGHGAGLMQIDDRSFPEFTNSTKWKDARLGILYGAKVLKQKWDDLQNNAGKSLRAKSYGFVGPRVSGATAQKIAIAAYNSGRFAAYHFSKGRDPDYGTTGKDYSSDVMQRARVFRELLGADGMLDRDTAIDPNSSKSSNSSTTSAAATSTNEGPNDPASLDSDSRDIITQPLRDPANSPDDSPPPSDTNHKIADTVQINEGDTASVVPPTSFVAEDKTIEAPPKDGATATTAKTTILGIAVPASAYAVVTGIQDWIEKGFLDVKAIAAALIELIRNNVKYVSILVGLIVAVVIVKKIFKQITFLLQVWIAARPDMHNVTVVPAHVEPVKKSWWHFWR